MFTRTILYVCMYCMYVCMYVWCMNKSKYVSVGSEILSQRHAHHKRWKILRVGNYSWSIVHLIQGVRHVCMYVYIVYAYMYVQYMYVRSSFTFTIINFLEDYYYDVFKTLNICMYVYICMYVPFAVILLVYLSMISIAY